MKFKKSIITFFTIFFLISNTFCKESTLKGIDLSNFIYNSILQKGYNPTKFSLSQTPDNIFAYNIGISIKKTKLQEDFAEKTYDSLIISFKQEDIIDKFDILFELIEFTQNSEFNFDTTILLTPCDNNLLEGNELLSGTESFSKLIGGTENTCALQISLDSFDYNYITAGAKSKVSPLWITKLTTQSFEQNKILSKTKGTFFLSLYRLNIFQTNSTLGSYLEKNIPAIEISLNCNSLSDEKIYSLLSTWITLFSEQEKYQNEIHYVPIKIGQKHYWIEEYVTVHILLILIILSLIILCDLGFIFRKNHSIRTIRTKRATRTFYTLPIYIITFSICLIFAQFLAYLFNKAIPSSSEIILLIKFNITFILISLICLVGFRLQKKANDFVYDYLIIIANLLNVFIFAAVDISLLYIFGLIYLISAISIFIKKTIPLVIILILNFFPYFLLIYQILLYSASLTNFIFLNPLQNFLVACAITPIFIQYLRILNIIKKSISKKQQESQLQIQKTIIHNIVKYFSITQTICVIIISVLIIIVTSSIKNYNQLKILSTSTAVNIYESPSCNLLTAKYSDSNYFGGINRNLFIKTNKDAYRVEIFVTSQSDNPIFYTAQTYSQTKKANQVKINLPDYPPENFSIFYTPDTSKVSIINVIAYYKKEDYPIELLNQKDIKLINKKFIRERTSIIIDVDKEITKNE